MVVDWVEVGMMVEGRVGVGVAAEGFGASQMHSVSPQSHSITVPHLQLHCPANF